MQTALPLSLKKMTVPAMIGSFSFLALCFVSCQKDAADYPTDGSGIWVLKRKVERGILTNYTWNSSYEYRPMEGAIIYRDTIDGIPNDERRYTYDLKGRVARVEWKKNGVLAEDHSLEYNADGLPVKVKGSSNEAIFTWTQTGTGWSGEFEDDGGGASGYQAVRKTYKLDEKRQLTTLITHFNNELEPNSIQEMKRSKKGGVLLEQMTSGPLDFRSMDSSLYTREERHAARLSEFQAYLAHGIQWFSNYDNIYLFPRLTNNSVFLDYDRQWPLHVVTYRKYPGDNSMPDEKLYDCEFETTYDANDNPVNLKLYDNGDLFFEIDFTWEKQPWVKPSN